MNLSRHKDAALSIDRRADEIGDMSQVGDVSALAYEVGCLSRIVADLCDDLTHAEPTVLRRGCWLHDAPSLWFLLVEQIDFSEEWWAVRFDRYGCAAPSLRYIHVADYQRVEAPDWWTA